MNENGFPRKLTRLIKTTMDGTQCGVNISGGLSGSLESRRARLCLLSNNVLEDVMRHDNVMCRKTEYGGEG